MANISVTDCIFFGFVWVARQTMLWVTICLETVGNNGCNKGIFFFLVMWFLMSLTASSMRFSWHSFWCTQRYHLMFPGVTGCFGSWNILHPHSGHPVKVNQTFARVWVASLHSSFLLSHIYIQAFSTQCCGIWFFSTLHRGRPANPLQPTSYQVFHSLLQALLHLALFLAVASSSQSYQRTVSFSMATWLDDMNRMTSLYLAQVWWWKWLQGTWAASPKTDSHFSGLWWCARVMATLIASATALSLSSSWGCDLESLPLVHRAQAGVSTSPHLKVSARYHCKDWMRNLIS